MKDVIYGTLGGLGVCSAVLVVVCGFVYVLARIDPVPTKLKQEQKSATPVGGGIDRVVVDAEHNVVCYRTFYGISCLQVK